MTRSINRDRAARATASLLASLALVCLLSGCAGSPELNYDERYRIFFRTPLSRNAVPTDTPQVLAESYAPADAVLESIHALGAEGYHLDGIRPVPGDDAASIFVFRRLLPGGARPTGRPDGFDGTWRVVEGGTRASHYIIAEGRDGFVVYRVAGGETLDRSVGANRGRGLEWTDDLGAHAIVLAEESMTLTHYLPEDEGAVILERLEADPDAFIRQLRFGRRHMVRLKPATPRYYDPYPW